MRSSWNFSTVIFEIWVLVLTKPGLANETPTTSLRVPGEYNYQNHHHHQHHVQHQHHHHSQHQNHQSHYHEQHYSVAGNTHVEYSRDSDSKHNNHHHIHPHQNQPRSLASTYYTNGNNNNNHHHNHHLDSAASSSSLYTPHRCYVCLPPNKNSREAQQILDIFAKEVRPLIPDCSAFDPYVDTGRFEFDCPPTYGGCLLRIHGSNISRACSRYRVNDCKKANSVEFCYCTTPLCNDKKPEPAVIPAVVHVSRNTDARRRGSSGSTSSNSRSRSSSSHIGENSQGIRTRVSDDEDILNRDDDEDDDDDNGGSGTGAPDQQLQTLIDPFTSTKDPTIFQEETVVVAVEDPNPHTKIGISMTASTSSGSSSSSRSCSTNSIVASIRSWVSWSPSQGALSRVWSTKQGIFHLFIHLHRAMFVHLFPEHVVDDQHQYDVVSAPADVDDDHDHDDSNHYLSSNQQETKGENREAVETTGSPFYLYSQLCFIISIVVLNGLLS
ncbi:unnamed protein product [Orchesella dallaii]|uniref:Uncharacterized protein n=1 Tax=Orchesella dallaii TaxID=48710 RepID=A0ABP1QIE1_9HEXA